jgi:hypothetical protein
LQKESRPVIGMTLCFVAEQILSEHSGTFEPHYCAAYNGGEKQHRQSSDPRGFAFCPVAYDKADQSGQHNSDPESSFHLVLPQENKKSFLLF